MPSIQSVRSIQYFINNIFNPNKRGIGENLQLFFKTILHHDSLTLIHLTLYRYSHQPTCLPFPSAQCEYLFWIRSAGNVSNSFFLWRGDRGHGVPCTLYTEWRGGARAQFRQNDAFFYTLLMHFLPKKNVKDCWVRL